MQPLSYAAFCALVADVLQLDAAQLTPETHFVNDLGVDSIRLLEILLRMDQMGIAISPELAWRIQTVGDAYRYYLAQVEATP